jgi:5'-methylthioadenosine phosphorylase
MNKLKAEIGIIGGSGLYEFFEKGKWVEVNTPYGKPSDKIFLTEYKGRKVAFLPRHGRKHQFPPHKINYRANLFAFKKLGVKRIIAPAAAGSLQLNVKRGDFVVCDQSVDRTNSRKDTFFDGPKTVHVSLASPYCSELRKIAIKACQKNKVRVHKKGTVVVIQGPRFSTRAESKWFTKMGWEVINMTQYPEAILARELEMCYTNILLITDYDAGLTGQKAIKPVTTEEVIKVFGQNIENVKKVILNMIEFIPEKQGCKCNEALKGAEI